MARRGKGIVIDDSTFQKRARALARRLKVDEYDFVKEQTGLLARESARFTPPYAEFPGRTKGTAIGKKADKLAGEGSIIKDMLLNFRIVDQSYIDHIYDITGQTNNIRRTLRTRSGRQYVVDVDRLNFGSVSEALAWHQSRRRNSDGRAINRGKAGGNDPNIGRWKSRDIMWVNQDVFNAVKKKLLPKVGMSKAAFSKASVMLGAKGAVPAWVKRHMGQVSGHGRMTKTARGAVGIIWGKAPGIFYLNNQIKRLQTDRLIKAVKRLEYISRQSAKKAGFKVY
jgi:hypothetical protein